MVTPIEIQNKNFKSGGLGYDKRDVDGFMKEVLKSYENIYRENMELNDKISVLNDRIQYYKSIEKTLQKALVLAEKTAEDTKAAAINNAKSIEKEALAKAQLIVADAKNERDQIHTQTIELVQQYDKYKAQFKNLAKAQIEVLESDSFSINVAMLEAFIPTYERENKGNDIIPDHNLTDETDNDSVEMYTKALMEAAVSEEKENSKTNHDTENSHETSEYSEINKGENEEEAFDFIDLEEESY